MKDRFKFRASNAKTKVMIENTMPNWADGLILMHNIFDREPRKEVE